MDLIATKKFGKSKTLNFTSKILTLKKKKDFLKKKNPHFSDGTVSYDLFKDYHFLPEHSANLPQNDEIVIPNIPLFSAGSSMKDAGYFTLMGFKAATSGMLTENDTQIFVKRTVQEIVWGYDDKLTEMGRQFMPDSGLKSDKFGLFAGRNHSVDARFTVFTGEGNLDQLGILKLFNNKSSYEVWPGKDCDRLRGKFLISIQNF